MKIATQVSDSLIRNMSVEEILKLPPTTELERQLLSVIEGLQDKLEESELLRSDSNSNESETQKEVDRLNKDITELETKHEALEKEYNQLKSQVTDFFKRKLNQIQSEYKELIGENLHDLT